MGEAFRQIQNSDRRPAGYNFGKQGSLSNVQLRFNLSNITNAQYRNPSSGSVVNTVKYGATNPSTVFYYLGAPRYAAVSMSADF